MGVFGRRSGSTGSETQTSSPEAAEPKKQGWFRSAVSGFAKEAKAAARNLTSTVTDALVEAGQEVLMDEGKSLLGSITREQREQLQELDAKIRESRTVQETSAAREAFKEAYIGILGEEAKSQFEQLEGNLDGLREDLTSAHNLNEEQNAKLQEEQGRSLLGRVGQRASMMMSNARDAVSEKISSAKSVKSSESVVSKARSKRVLAIVGEKVGSAIAATKIPFISAVGEKLSSKSEQHRIASNDRLGILKEQYNKELDKIEPKITKEQRETLNDDMLSSVALMGSKFSNMPSILKNPDDKTTTGVHEATDRHRVANLGEMMGMIAAKAHKEGYGKEGTEYEGMLPSLIANETATKIGVDTTDDIFSVTGAEGKTYELNLDGLKSDVPDELDSRRLHSQAVLDLKEDLETRSLEDISQTLKADTIDPNVREALDEQSVLVDQALESISGLTEGLDGVQRAQEQLSQEVSKVQERVTRLEDVTVELEEKDKEHDERLTRHSMDLAAFDAALEANSEKDRERDEATARNTARIDQGDQAMQQVMQMMQLMQAQLVDLQGRVEKAESGRSQAESVRDKAEKALQEKQEQLEEVQKQLESVQERVTSGEKLSAEELEDIQKQTREMEAVLQEARDFLEQDGETVVKNPLEVVREQKAARKELRRTDSKTVVTNPLENLSPNERKAIKIAQDEARFTRSARATEEKSRSSLESGGPNVTVNPLQVAEKAKVAEQEKANKLAESTRDLQSDVRVKENPLRAIMSDAEKAKASETSRQGRVARMTRTEAAKSSQERASEPIAKGDIGPSTRSASKESFSGANPFFKAGKAEETKAAEPVAAKQEKPKGLGLVAIMKHKLFGGKGKTDEPEQKTVDDSSFQGANPLAGSDKLRKGTTVPKLDLSQVNQGQDVSTKSPLHQAAESATARGDTTVKEKLSSKSASQYDAYKTQGAGVTRRSARNLAADGAAQIEPKAESIARSAKLEADTGITSSAMSAAKSEELRTSQGVAAGAA